MTQPMSARRPNSDAFKRTAVIAVVVFFLLAVLGALTSDLPAQAIGAALGIQIIPFLITATAAFLMRRRWTWLIYVGVYLGIFLVLRMIAVVGAAAG